MFFIKNCPACGFSPIQTLKKYKFYPPESIKNEQPADDVSFTEERLWIFFKIIWKGKLPAEIEMDLCGNCGFIFTNPRYITAEIALKYNTVDLLPSAKRRVKLNPARKHSQRANRIYRLITSIRKKTGLENEKGAKKVLDVGGAEGYNLLPFIKNNYDCYLLDYVKKDDYAQGIKYLGKDVLELGADDKFDVILFCHTLEHVTNPAEVVAQLKKHLTQNGLLYIEVPLGVWKEWIRLKEPLTHVNFFSEESLYKLTDNVGLNPVYLSTDYQWITHYKLWCVNLVAQNSGNSIQQSVKYQSAKEQMKYFKYAFLMFLQEPSLLLKSLKYKLGLIKK